jgi:hypothetical protein
MLVDFVVGFNLSLDELVDELKIGNGQREIFHQLVVEKQLVLLNKNNQYFQCKVFGNLVLETASDKVFHEMRKIEFKDLRALVWLQ